MVYGRYNYSFHGVYKPTNITGGHHPVDLSFISGGSNLFMAVITNTVDPVATKAQPQGGRGLLKVADQVFGIQKRQQSLTWA